MIVLLCGPPASGKTTLAREILKRRPDAAYLASDELGRGRRDRYRVLLRRAREAAERHALVILDATYYSRAHRDRVRALGRPVLLAHLACPLRECLRRNAARPEDERIPEEAVRNLWGRLEPPGEDEQPIRISTLRVRPGAAARRVLQALRRLERGLDPRPPRTAAHTSRVAPRSAAGAVRAS